MKSPLVSVLMATYNMAETIGPAIKSILLQAYENFEFIIVDDGSQDNTIDVIKSFNDPRIILLQNRQNLKLPKSLNKAIDAAKGKYFARMDADDLSMPDRLRIQVEFLENHPEIDAIDCFTYFFADNGVIMGKLPQKALHHNELIKDIHRRSPIGHASMMAKGEWFRKHRYNENYFRAQDRDLFLRSYRVTTFGRVPHFLYAVREPNKIDIPKMMVSNYYEISMLIKNWKIYGIKPSKIIPLTIFFAGRLAYYLVIAACGRNKWWRYTKLGDNDPQIFKDQEWIYKCLAN